MEFQLHVYSNDFIPRKLGPRIGSFSSKNDLALPAITSTPDIFIEKIGAFPEIKTIPNKLITNYFDRESNIWYYKGINALAKNFGIGALA